MTPQTRAPGAPARTRRQRPRSPWWVALTVLPLVLASDWRWRLRGNAEAISGSFDLVILLEVGVYGLVALWLAVRFDWRPGGGRASGLWLVAWPFAGVTVLAALWSPFLGLGAVRGAQLLVIASVGQAIATHATRGELHRLGHALLLLCAAGVLIGSYWEPVEVPGPAAGRFTWLAIHPVLSATYLSIGIVLATAYALTPGLRASGIGWPAWCYVVLGGLCAYGLALNQTRGALFGTVLGVLVLVFERVRRRDSMAVVVGAVLAAVTVAATLGPQLLSYVERGEGADSLRTLNSRTELWGEAIQAWRGQPLSGLGTGATRGVFLESTGLGGGHNAFFNVLVDTGAVGALLWIGLLLALARALLSLRPGSDRPLLSGLLVTLVVMGFTTEGLGASANVSMVLLFVLLGWVSAVRRSTPAPAPRGG